MVRIKKNFLPSLFFNKLKTIVTSSTLPWYFNSQTVGNKRDKTDNHFMFTHVLYNSLEKAHSAWFKDFEPIIYFLDNKIKVNKLLRMKLNIYTNQNKRIKHVSHQDILVSGGVPKKNTTIVLLNFTTCNGGTVINGNEYASNENEMLSFNNLNKHYGITQTDTQTRIILNIALD